MKKISRLICAVACCVPVALQAQTSEKITSPVNLYKEGKELFLQKLCSRNASPAHICPPESGREPERRG